MTPTTLHEDVSELKAVVFGREGRGGLMDEMDHLERRIDQLFYVLLGGFTSTIVGLLVLIVHG